MASLGYAVDVAGVADAWIVGWTRRLKRLERNKWIICIFTVGNYWWHWFPVEIKRWTSMIRINWYGEARPRKPDLWPSSPPLYVLNFAFPILSGCAAARARLSSLFSIIRARYFARKLRCLGAMSSAVTPPKESILSPVIIMTIIRPSFRRCLRN